MIIMGIDPGTNRAGYGVIEVTGREVRCLVLGDIELHKFRDPYTKLRHLFERVASLVEAYNPDEVALESPFFGENIQSMLKLGRAQGVAMAAALVRGVPVAEYAPMRIKQSITGRGSASKEQVAAMLKMMLGVEYNIKRLDATDGLAVAMCHHFTLCSPGGVSLPGKKKRAGSWENFVSSNPGRIKKP